MDEEPIYSRPNSHKHTRMVHVEDEFMACTSFEEANATLGNNSAVAITEHPSASNSQLVESQPHIGSDSPSWSYRSNSASPVQQEQSGSGSDSDPQQAPAVTSALMTPEKPATLNNAKVLLRKADKLLSGKMAHSHSQGEEGFETLISRSSPWSSPSSNESEDDLQKARGLLSAAHNMLELFGSKKNDEIWKRGQHYEEEGSLDRSAELGEKDIMDWEAETTAEQSCVAELRGRISDLEAQLRDFLADLDSERERSSRSSGKDWESQSGCVNTAEKQSKNQVDRDERMIAALREHSASLDKHTAALERHTAAMKERTRGSGDI
ncbi:hypothetical protein KCU64_g1237, partial [Aureobasidium melanogenum]